MTLSRSRTTGTAALVTGTGLDSAAGLIFSGYWYPPAWLHWIDWPGLVLPGLLLTALGLALLVRRPGGWYDSEEDRLDGRLVRVLRSMGWLTTYISAAAALYFAVLMVVLLSVPTCLDPDCIVIGGLGAFIILGYVALFGVPAGLLLLGISLVLGEFFSSPSYDAE